MTAARKASKEPVLAEGGPVLADGRRTDAAGDGAASSARGDSVAEGAGGEGAGGEGAAGEGAAGEGAAGEGAAGQHRGPARVLADRIAAALVHHEPGWRLPRHTALARRYDASTAQIDAAVRELTARHLVRRLPDGQLYRASPAEYLITLGGSPRLASQLDPMGAKIACRSRQVSWRRVPEDIGWVLGVRPGDPACVVRLLWTADGEPAALATTYLARHVVGQPAERDATALAALAALPLLATPAPPAADDADDADAADDAAAPAEDKGAAFTPRALYVEMQPPPPSVARSLRLSTGQSAAVVTVRFDDPAEGRPAALTVTVLRPDLFRIVVESPAGLDADGSEGSFPGAWTHGLQDWEP